MQGTILFWGWHIRIWNIAQRLSDIHRFLFSYGKQRGYEQDSRANLVAYNNSKYLRNFNLLSTRTNEKKMKHNLYFQLGSGTGARNRKFVRIIWSENSTSLTILISLCVNPIKWHHLHILFILVKTYVVQKKSSTWTFFLLLLLFFLEKQTLQVMGRALGQTI